MKVRIGFSAGVATAADAAGRDSEVDRFAELVDGLETHGFDSVWVPEVLTAATLDPLSALAFAAGRTAKLKIGSHLAVPGRGPARLAKELATLDRLSQGRLLLTFVIGLPQGPELSAYGVAASERTGMLDETVGLLRRFWSGETVDHTGEYFSFEGVGIEPRPWQQPLEVWYGGMAPSALRRCGRLADGWIPGFIAPEKAAAAKVVIDEAARQADRAIDPEHFGMNLLYRRGPLDPSAAARLAARFPQLDHSELAALVPDAATGGGLGRCLERYVDAGFSKFVLRPAHHVTSWPDELGALAEEALPHQRATR